MTGYLTSDGLAARLGISLGKLSQLNTAGRIPAPDPFWKRPLYWSIAEIDAWEAAGKPPRKEWDRVREARKQSLTTP